MKTNETSTTIGFDINLDELSTPPITTKVGLRRLTLTRIEGPVELCRTSVVFTSDDRGSAWAHLPVGRAIYFRSRGER